ncbi:hypothetical protein BH20ACI4_BH20ACI4_18620 [soil metagenome]
MIDNIVTREIWAESLSEQTASRSLTVYLNLQNPQPKITAQISLSRVEGRGNAKAFIRQYEQRFPRDAEPILSPLEPPFGKGDPNELLYAPSAITINFAHSVTFQVRVKNMFAYATCVIFIHHTTLLEDILAFPINIFGSISGDR